VRIREICCCSPPVKGKKTQTRSTIDGIFYILDKANACIRDTAAQYLHYLPDPAQWGSPKRNTQGNRARYGEALVSEERGGASPPVAAGNRALLTCDHRDARMTQGMVLD